MPAEGMSVHFPRLRPFSVLHVLQVELKMAEPATVEKLLPKSLAAIELLRSEGSLVHCITNTVAQNFTANVLLACGATPSMTVSPNEVQYFSSRADAVLFNLGTMDDQRTLAIKLSLEVCGREKKPFVLDPVMCHVSQPRLDLAREIVSSGPAIIRVNEQEMAALSGFVDHGKCTIARTGTVDLVMSGERKISVSNGHLWLSKVTAVGCAQGALMAALLAKCSDSLVASVGALIWVGVAGENAAAMSAGPGSFQANFIDQLANLSVNELETKARLS